MPTSSDIPPPHPHPEHPPSSSPSSSSSSPPSSSSHATSTASSSRSVHPLLPPLGPQADSTLAFEIDPHAEYLAATSLHGQRKSEIPEKCFTFCSQRADGAAMCRMFCLRRRQPLATQKEELKRLRPQRLQRQALGQPTSAGLLDVPDAAASNGAPTAGETRQTAGSWLDALRWPFEALKRRADPYSFIYVTGTFDGVVGRYMEELEYDDGISDFGSLSRASKQRRGEEKQMEVLDWGDHGTLVHLPLTSLLYPILSIPQTLSRLCTPGLNLLTAYRESFTDGSQSRSLAKFTDELNNGGAWKMLNKMGEYRQRQLREALEKAKENSAHSDQQYQDRPPPVAPGSAPRRPGLDREDGDGKGAQ